MSIGKGRFHFTFKKVEDFTTALAVSYLKETNKRCWVLVSENDNLVIVQPSVSTIGLNVLILETGNVDIEKLKLLRELFIKEDVPTLFAEYLRRPSQAQGFTVGFKEVDNFIKSLNLFYLTKNKNRCRVIVSQKGPLLVQPSVSTLELNTLVLESFSSIMGKEKGKIDDIISSLETINCDSIENPFKTTNF